MEASKMVEETGGAVREGEGARRAPRVAAIHDPQKEEEPGVCVFSRKLNVSGRKSQKLNDGKKKREEEK